jgi:2-hydroxychromene-2-carboxylate isomerase
VKRPPCLYFSFRSPFSWMAVEVLRREIPTILDEIELRPFWDPDERTEAALTDQDAGFHYMQMSKAKHLYILQDTKRQAARLGLPMRWPIDVNPWWEIPHLAWLRARRCGLAEPFYDAVVRARWHHGANVCDRDAIRALATEVGADPDLLAGAVDDDEIRAEGVRCLTDAWNDDVFGIPYLRAGRHRFWGLDRVADFLAEYRRLRAETVPATTDEPGPALAVVPVGAYDTDTAGGCG